MYESKRKFAFETGNILFGITLAAHDPLWPDKDTGSDFCRCCTQLPVAGMQIMDTIFFKHQPGGLKSACAPHGDLGIA